VVEGRSGGCDRIAVVDGAAETGPGSAAMGVKRVDSPRFEVGNVEGELRWTQAWFSTRLREFTSSFRVLSVYCG
jgi:hypothetical protein